jgi:hypothetical protein
MDLWLHLASVSATDLLEAAVAAEDCGVTGVAFSDELLAARI